MREFIIAERYRLELHWSEVLYKDQGVVHLYDAFFSGPVLGDVSVIQEDDSINMDFGKQYSRLLSNYYVVRLFWGGVRITSDKIYLSDVRLNNKHLNSLPKLKDSDYIVIDTSDHIIEKHHKNLNYRAYLLNCDGVLYNFGGENA